jgi:hypothetical protein
VLDLFLIAFTYRGGRVQFLGIWRVVAQYFTHYTILDDGAEVLLAKAILLIEALILTDQLIPLCFAAGIPFDQ